VIEIAGLRIAGFGGAGPTRFGFPYEWKESRAEEVLRTMLTGAPPVDILISHTPPARTSLDRTARGVHVGSEAVRRQMASARPGLVVCGHIHESWGFERVDGVLCLNAGALGDPFGEEIVWRVDWTGGRPSAITSFHAKREGEPDTRDWL
jgi:Icc-related predicted phosphoesterase